MSIQAAALVAAEAFARRWGSSSCSMWFSVVHHATEQYHGTVAKFFFHHNQIPQHRSKASKMVVMASI